MPSMTTSTTEPGFIGNTPRDVPQAMTSPGINVMSLDSKEMIVSGEKIMSLHG